MTPDPVLEPRPDPALLSLVIPLHDEAAMLPLLREALEAFAPTLPCEVEFVLVNDGSHDATVVGLLAWAAGDRRMKLISLSRNFGHQVAVTAGLDTARGEAVVVLDADLQDPLEVIPAMLVRYREGYDIAYGQRLARPGEGLCKRASAWLFYRLQRRFVHPDLPLDAGDFRLLSRRCLDALLQLRERHRLLRGMGAWVGFPQVAVPYRRAPRVRGETSYTLRRMMRLAADGALSFSPAPLRGFVWAGAAVAMLGAVVGFYAFLQGVRHLIGLPVSADYNPGWATLVTLICVVGGMLLICVGMIGEYVSRIYEEVKQRPLYIVALRRNLDE
jgi:glycosyltransferase involved in cell wall biosynthesis